MLQSIIIKKLILVALTILLFACNDNSNLVYNTVTISSNQVSENLFIQTVNWGLTGDSQTTVISATNKIDFDKLEKESVYIFNGLQPFSYKQHDDSLILYLQQPVQIPQKIKTKWKIIQKVVDNPTLIELRQNKEIKDI